MPPLPKPPGMRQRRNKTPGATVLPAAGWSGPVPQLPERSCIECAGSGEGKSGDCPACGGAGLQPWHPLVVSWWTDVWASPMACEFVKADIHGLFVLAELRNQFWHSGEKELAAEIRLQEQRFGLSSLDRRRLQWEVERLEQAQNRRPNPRPQTKVSGDPRRFLRPVK